jgi:hydrogenase-4 component H
VKAPKIRELGEAMRSLFGKPATSPFPKVIAESPENLRGRPVFDIDRCVGCGACAMVCPVPTISYEDVRENGRAVRRFLIGVDNCVFCGQCADNCITGDGIQLTGDYLLATLDKTEMRQSFEKELLLCELCDSVISTVDHVRFVADEVGEAAFSNPTLMLTALQQLQVAPAVRAEPAEKINRADRLRVLCPRCRRETALRF